MIPPAFPHPAAALAPREALGLRGKPAPDLFLRAADALGVRPARAAVIEDAAAGVAAARAGGFGLVIGVAADDRGQALLDAGADLVVRGLRALAEAGALRAP